MALEPTTTITYRSTVTEDQIDHLGHMNVRFYAINARRGTHVLLEELGAPESLTVRLADVYTRHLREQLLGAALVVRSGVIEATPEALLLYHELANTETEEVAASFVHRVVSADGGDDGSMPEALVDRASAQVIEVPAYGRPRSIDLGRNPLTNPPVLDDLIERKLEMRKPRSIRPEECGEDGYTRLEAVAELLWDGEPIDETGGRPMLHDGPNGEKMGWASMETRMSIRRLPRSGDRIQSFGAVTELRDKTSQVVHWAYDIEQGDLLVAFEVVNLAFDTISRTAMAIPDHVREVEETFYHADLTE